MTGSSLEHVMNWRGAAPDRFSFYSTQSSISQEDWLPVLNSKFKLHLNHQSQKQQKDRKFPTLYANQKTGSGFSKNTTPYVAYCKKVDEPDIK